MLLGEASTQLTRMRKPSITKKQASMGGGKETLKRPQRGLGVAELERIRLQEEQEERFFYHAASHHHYQQQPADHPHCSTHLYNLHYQQLPFFPNHLPSNPNFSSPNPNSVISNPNFMHPSLNFNGEAPTCNSLFIAAPPTKPSLSPAGAAVCKPLVCSPTLLVSLPTKPTLNMSNTHSAYTAVDHFDFSLPYGIAAQKPLAANAAAASFAASNPNIAPFHNTNPNLKIPNVNSASSRAASSPSCRPDTPIELSFLPLHSSSSIKPATDSTPQPTAADGRFSCMLEAPLYLAGSPSVENPPSLTDLCLDLPPSIHGHNSLMTPKKNTSSVLALQEDAEELELPSFQNMVFNTQESTSCDYEKQYMRCNFDLNNTQGEYDLTLNPKVNPRSRTLSFGGTSVFGVDTSPRDDFLKLGLPTISEEWNQVSMQTLDEYTSNPRMDLCCGQMVKGNKTSLDLELKLSLPSFGYR